MMGFMGVRVVSKTGIAGALALFVSLTLADPAVVSEIADRAAADAAEE